MKRLIEKLADRAGYQVVANWRAKSLPLAKKMREIFKLLQIESVIDVGANEGQYHDFLRGEVGFHGQIWSFEPLPDLARKLAERAKADALWKIFPVALGVQAETKSMNQMTASVFSSFLSPAADLAPNFVGWNKVQSTHEVTVRTLDSMASEFGDLSHTYLKIDTQGFDLQVLKGGAAVVGRVPALQTEVSFRPLYGGMPHFDESIKAFEAAGFAVSDFFYVAGDDNLRAWEFDCLMVRR